MPRETKGDVVLREGADHILHEIINHAEACLSSIEGRRFKEAAQHMETVADYANVVKEAINAM